MQAVKEFLGWLSKYSPEVYAGVMDAVPEAAAAISTPAHMEGLGQDPTTAQSTAEAPWWETVLDAASGVAEAYFTYEAQKDILDIQKERATQGLPPIETEAYAPTIRHAVDIPPEFKQAAMGTGTLVALGIGAVLLFMFATR